MIYLEIEMAVNRDLKRELELEKKFASALPSKFKVIELEEGIKKCEQNIKVFSDQVQSQIIQKAQFEAELASLRANSSASPKIKEVEDAIKKAEENIKIFSDEVQKLIILKAQLEQELTTLRAKIK